MQSNPGLFTFLIFMLAPTLGWTQDHLPLANAATAARIRVSDPQETQTYFGDSRPETASDTRYATIDEATGPFVPPEPGTASLDPIVQPLPEYTDLSSSEEARFASPFSTDSSQFDIGLNLYSAPPFAGGLIVFGPNVAMKIGGFVKADFIYDFNPIDSTDSFVTTSIPVDAPPRTNSRFHARQSRLSFDTRWLSDDRVIRIYVEGDFFSDDDQFRLRQAFGEVGSLLVGRTWTTFTDVAAAPATLDFEGSVSNVNRRQAQARWTQMIFHEDLKLALAVEDTRFIIDTPTGITGESRSPSPDFVGHLRLDRERAQLQVASLFRVVGFQPTGQSVITKSAWGLNFTGVYLITETTKVYSQILFGEGIGSYRDLPDAAPTAVDQGGLLPMFGWMIGATHNWNESLSSNFTYAQNDLGTTAFQNPNDVDQTTYLSANLIWSPLERVKVGVEYLYGTRTNVNGAMGDAHRLQASFIFDLP
ncbi:DcaP family trimeric outer membrane transporter [Gimesia maris]|uniref:DcaP family trimeric outer membrane transporter n=1 Tax=Gimesia maris TaxID=122 RepID=UPI0030DB1953|tara:strand:- start:56 stop:1483 length:1428 start_codon:yes stop_codon:yes gene_type:complete